MHRQQTLPWRFVASLVVLFVKLMGWRVEVRGLENVPRRGGAVIAFNHHSYADFLMVAWDIHRKLHRSIRFLAKREIWQSPWVGWVVKAGNAVPVDRASKVGRHRAFAAAEEALENGDLVAVAPEQTISRSFELLPFRTGAARMAQAAGVPIIPCIGWGTHRFATKGQPRRLARKIPVTVEYGEPIHIGPDDEPEAVTAKLQQRMEAMLDRVQREYPDEPEPGDDWWVPQRLGGSAPDYETVLAEHRQRQQATWSHGSTEDQGTAEDQDLDDDAGSDAVAS